MEVIQDHIIQVTRELSGRQPTECEFITTKFRHLWRKNDKIDNKLAKQ
ncbi:MULTISPECIES: hypothetical protein [Bizionia]|nr:MULTISPECIES: hypothetical protein [Bizionia]